jgi:predicted DNA binding protein
MAMVRTILGWFKFMSRRRDHGIVQHVRLTLTPVDEIPHPLINLVAESRYVSGAKLLDLNPTDDDRPAVLFVIEGDRERFAADLDATPEIPDYDLTPLDDGRFYAYLRPETNPVIRDLIGTLTRDSLLINFPVEYRDGSSRLTLIGTRTDLQAAVENLPSGITVEIERVGEYTDYEAVTSVLSERQREAVEVGLALGYYETLGKQRTRISPSDWIVRRTPPPSISKRPKRRSSRPCSTE